MSQFTSKEIKELLRRAAELREKGEELSKALDAVLTEQRNLLNEVRRRQSSPSTSRHRHRRSER